MEQHDYGRFRVRSFCIYERSVNRHDYLLATRTDTELFTENGGPRDQPFEGLRHHRVRGEEKTLWCLESTWSLTGDRGVVVS